MSSLQKIVENLIIFSWSEQPIRATCFAVLLVLLISFISFYIIPAFLWLRRLGLAVRYLRTIRNDGTVIELNALESNSFSHRILNHLWHEYCETLHPETATDANGQQRVIRYRSTVPAETFFSYQALVDSPLRAEFFKHLPGIYTGIGIIGTFLGLIQGLKGFTISEDTKVVQGSLEVLMKGVSEAFTVSFAAIFLAMVCTFFEKIFYMALVKKVEELCASIDCLFDAGAGEEYLARLVKASEESKTHLAQLKDSLVGDLRQILSDISSQQIEAIKQAASTQEAATKNSGKAITADLATELKGHLDRFIDRSTDSQGAAVQKILADLIAGFTAKIDDTFGGQMRGLNELLTTTTDKVAGLVDTVNSMAGNLKDAGKGAADALSKQIETALLGMKANQDEMNRQMKDFVYQIKESVSSSQSETNQRIQETLLTLGGNVSAMIEGLKEQAREAANGHQEREGHFQKITTDAVLGISGQVDKLIGDIAKSTMEMQGAITKLSEVSLGSIGRMESAAENISLAADAFTEVGTGMTGALEQIGTVSREMTVTTGRLSSIAANISVAEKAYQTTSQQIAIMLQSLKEIVENARREASMTLEQIRQIALAAKSLSEAEKEAEEYLNKVSQVLTVTHQKFADNIGRTLTSGNTEFHKQLSTATGHLRGAIEQLSETIDTIPSSR